MKVRLSPRAARDLAAIGDHVSVVNPGAAKATGASIAAAVRLIGLYPGIGRRQADHRLRKLVVPRYGYLIYYRVNDDADAAAIVTIRHPSRARPIADA